MTRTLLVGCLLIISSTSLAENLVPPNGARGDDVIQHMRGCYSNAMGPLAAGGELLKGVDKELLQGKSTAGFLYDGRPLPPRDDGVLVPRESLFNALRSSTRTDPYVVCLLMAGFRWETSKESGIEVLQRLADQGSVRAQAEFGRAYYLGLGVVRNNSLAFKWLNAAASANDSDAQFLLGVLYSEGDGALPNDDLALQWVRKAADAGHQQAQRVRTHIEKMAEDRRKANQAAVSKVSEIKAAAEAGNSESQRILAGYYIEGVGVTQDATVAIDWYKKAGQAGDVKSLTQLGVLYDKGRGIAVDYSEAVKWYKLAAEKGDSQAQYNLGILMYFGAGSERNQVEGKEWVRRAAEQSNEMAIRALPSLR